MVPMKANETKGANEKKCRMPGGKKIVVTIRENIADG